MFRPMRRSGQALPEEECKAILRDATYGVLAVQGDDGYPYTVPVNHVYEDGKLAFHCAVTGHKIDAITSSDKVSFCVVWKDDVSAERQATDYISVIAFGRAALVDDPDQKRRICEAIGQKFAPEYMKECRNETEMYLQRGGLACVEITVEHMTGKCGLHVMQERKRTDQK